MGHHYVGEGMEEGEFSELVKTLQPLRRTTKRSASRLRKAKVRRDMVTSSKKLSFDSNLRHRARVYASKRLAHVFLLLYQVFESRGVAGAALSIFRCLDD